MRPSDIAKAAGLKSLKEVSRHTKVSEQTLVDWCRNKNELFVTVINGTVAMQSVDPESSGLRPQKP